jgi:hypothetical protein
MYFMLDLSFYMFAVIFWIRQIVKVEKKSTTTSILKWRECDFRLPFLFLKMYTT